MNLLMEKQTSSFFLNTPTHYRQDGLFFPAGLHFSQNHYPPVLRATTVEPIIHVAKPSNPKWYDPHPSLEQSRNQKRRPNLPITGTRTTDSYSCRNRDPTMGDDRNRKPLFPLTNSPTGTPNTSPFPLLSKAEKIQVHCKLFKKKNDHAPSTPCS